jgi:hypothetical protein
MSPLVPLANLAPNRRVGHPEPEPGRLQMRQKCQRNHRVRQYSVRRGPSWEMQPTTNTTEVKAEAAVASLTVLRLVSCDTRDAGPVCRARFQLRVCDFGASRIGQRNSEAVSSASEESPGEQATGLAGFAGWRKPILEAVPMATPTTHSLHTKKTRQKGSVQSELWIDR